MVAVAISVPQQYNQVKAFRPSPLPFILFSQEDMTVAIRALTLYDSLRLVVMEPEDDSACSLILAFVQKHMFEVLAVRGCRPRALVVCLSLMAAMNSWGEVSRPQPSMALMSRIRALVSDPKYLWRTAGYQVEGGETGSSYLPPLLTALTAVPGMKRFTGGALGDFRLASWHGPKREPRRSCCSLSTTSAALLVMTMVTP